MPILAGYIHIYMYEDIYMCVYLYIYISLYIDKYIYIEMCTVQLAWTFWAQGLM